MSTIEELLVKSDFLEETLITRLYLPKNYSPLYTYPLIIAQDGPDYFNLGRLGTLLTELSEAGQIEKVIVCGLPYPDIKTRWKRCHPDGDQHMAYLHFLHRELLPTLRADYAVESLASGVTLLGDSLGGTVSFHAALHYPNAFGNVIMQSPFINDHLIEKANQSTTSTLRLYHSIGRAETKVKTTHGETANFLAPNRTLYDLLKSRPFAAYVFEEHEGDHTWGAWQPDLKNALLDFFKI
jgi:enterochelin esterase-like enzyme